MSQKHPIISITGSSGAGTSTVRDTFAQIFFREKVKAAFIEGDAFHRFDRAEFDPRKFLVPAMDAMEALVADRFERFGCAGNASRIKPIALSDMAQMYASGKL